MLDWKCAVTNAILTVLIYLLVVKMMGPNNARPLAESANWYESMEVLLLASAFVGFNVNTLLFGNCRILA